MTTFSIGAVAYEERLKKSARNLSIKEGCVYSLQEGFGQRYITPYALALGASNTHIGMLTALPSIIGNFSQLYGSKIIEKISRRSIAFYGALLQSLMWLPVIALGALFFIFSINSMTVSTALVLVYTLLVLFGAFFGPAWSSWMKDLVPENERGSYFGIRNAICGFTALLCMLLAGFILDYFRQTSLFFGFVILFAIAFTARLSSALMLRLQYEPGLKLEKSYYFGFRQFLKAMPRNNFGRFVIYVALVNFATGIAAPFFAVYMLRNLGFSYANFTIVMISATITSLLFMPLIGKFADKYGNLTVIRIAGLLIPLIPILWVFSHYLISSLTLLLIYLVIIELFGGIVWAGFNLSAANFIYDSVSRQHMALCVAYSNILNGIAVFIGADLGGLLAAPSISFLWLEPLLFVFLVSGLARLAVYFAVIPTIKEVRDVPKFGIKEAKEILHGLTPEMLKHFPLKIRRL